MDPKQDNSAPQLALGAMPADMGAQEPEESYADQVELTDAIMPDAKDGEEVTFQGKGKIVEHEDGTRCVKLSEIDGQPLEAKEEDAAPEGEEGGEDAELSTEDKLDSAIGKINKTPQKY